MMSQEIRFCQATAGVTLAWARSGRGPPPGEGGEPTFKGVTEALGFFEVIFGLQAGIEPLFWLMPFAVILSLATAVLTVAVWRGGWYSKWGRVHYSLLALAAVGFVVFATQYGLFW